MTKELRQRLDYERKRTMRYLEKIIELEAEADALRAKLTAPHEAVEADVVRWLTARGHEVRRQSVA
jgi:hypothetical protein